MAVSVELVGSPDAPGVRLTVLREIEARTLKETVELDNGDSLDVLRQLQAKRAKLRGRDGSPHETAGIRGRR